MLAFVRLAVPDEQPAVERILELALQIALRSKSRENVKNIYQPPSPTLTIECRSISILY